MGINVTGDPIVDNLQSDRPGRVSFNVDVNGDAFGSTHVAFVNGPGNVTVLEETQGPGTGKFCSYKGTPQRGSYEIQTACPPFEGLHYTVRLLFAIFPRAGSTVQAVAAEMTNAEVSTALIVDASNSVVGVVTETEIVRHIGRGGSVTDDVVRVMHHRPPGTAHAR